LTTNKQTDKASKKETDRRIKQERKSSPSNGILSMISGLSTIETNLLFGIGTFVAVMAETKGPWS
jgi:hypothetical protein